MPYKFCFCAGNVYLCMKYEEILVYYYHIVPHKFTNRG